MGIGKLFIIQDWFDSYLQQKICPIHMHAVEDNGHWKQIHIFEAYHVPFVIDCWSISEYLRKEADGIYENSEVNPNECHDYVN